MSVACVPQVDSYRKMVMKAAWSAWRKLPLQTRSWLGIDDMVQDGLEWLHLEAGKRWNRERASMSTFVYTAIDHFYTDNYGSKLGRPDRKNGRHFGSQKRWEGRNVSIDDMEKSYRERGVAFEMERALRLPVRQDVERHLIMSCTVVKGMTRVWEEASHPTQVEMKRWFFEQNTKKNTNGQRFVEARVEFLHLATKHEIGIEECRHLMRSPICLDDLSRSLWGLPADMDRPDPRNEARLKGWLV